MRKPCDVCVKRCTEVGCNQWEQWFLEKWEELHRAVWLLVDSGWKSKEGAFLYWDGCPCDSCPCKAWCKTPCAGKERWQRETG